MLQVDKGLARRTIDIDMGRQGPGACTKATPAEESPSFVEGFAVCGLRPRKDAQRASPINLGLRRQTMAGRGKRVDPDQLRSSREKG